MGTPSIPGPVQLKPQRKWSVGRIILLFFGAVIFAYILSWFIFLGKHAWSQHTRTNQTIAALNETTRVMNPAAHGKIAFDKQDGGYALISKTNQAPRRSITIVVPASSRDAAVQQLETSLAKAGFAKDINESWKKGYPGAQVSVDIYILESGGTQDSVSPELDVPYGHSAISISMYDPFP